MNAWVPVRPELPPLPPELKPLGSQLANPAEIVAPDHVQTEPQGPTEANEASGTAFVKDASTSSPTPAPTSNSNFKPVLAAAVALALIGGVVFFVSQLMGGTAIVSQLESGECLENFFENAPDGSFVEIRGVSTVDCAEPHAFEVFSTSSTLFPDETFPGVEEAFAVGQEFCLTEYETFIDGDRQNLSTWDVWTFVPPESAWEGDRVVQCLVGDFNQETLFEGTLRGAAGTQAG